MVVTLIIFICGVFSILSCNCSPVSPENPNEFQNRSSTSQVFRVYAKNEKDLSALVKLYEEDGNLVDFWTKPSLNRGTDIMIHGNEIETIKTYLESRNITFDVFMNDVERNIVKQQLENDKVRGSTKSMNWDSYQNLDTIYEWIQSLQQTHPSLIRVETIGYSSESKPLLLVKISANHNKLEDDETSSSKPSIFIDSGFHAREWISISTTTYIINELVNSHFKHADLLSTYDFYILPIVNPDGYNYSFTTSRMWRKNRAPYKTAFPVKRTCSGVDLNRNFGHQFGGSGTSSNPCSEIYRGPHAFSEPESRAIRDYVLKHNADGKFKAYLTIHSYSQVWLYPWGYTSDLPSDWKELDAMAKLGTEAIRKKYGTSYEYGSSTNVLYSAAGGSDDYMKAEAGIKYSYTIELRDTGNYGFLLPPNQIVPTGEETWEGLVALLNNI